MKSSKTYKLIAIVLMTFGITYLNFNEEWSDEDTKAFLSLITGLVVLAVVYFSSKKIN